MVSEKDNQPAKRSALTLVQNKTVQRSWGFELPKRPDFVDLKINIYNIHSNQNIILFKRIFIEKIYRSFYAPTGVIKGEHMW
jgi:hypothetical protein